MLKPAVIDKLKREREKKHIDNRIPLYVPNPTERIKQKHKESDQEAPKSRIIVIEMA
ncbi:hypothetical protein KKA47_06575 [bacterium]|nr:hypothetical protein [bacterium]